MKIYDLHSHTYYSACGKDEPEKLVTTVMSGGVQLLGITDHNYGIGDRKRQYFEEMTALQKKYAGQIRILRGIEIATINDLCIRPEEDISYMDYCLVEHIDRPGTCVGRDIVKFSQRCGIPTGIAHTDLFAMIEAMGEKPETFLKHLADHDIFWEMNVNYDSIHGFNEHAYVKRFMADERQQELVRESGLRVSVGFDSHRADEYKPDRVVAMCRFLSEKNIPGPKMIE